MSPNWFLHVSFFNFLLEPNILPTINFLNEWGQTLLGLSLILGVLIQIGSVLGALLMILYYLPVLSFPYVGTHSFLVDDHIIYLLVFILLGAVRAGEIWGLDGVFKKMKEKRA